MVTVELMIETAPPDQSGRGPDHQTRTERVTAPTYEQGRDELMSAIPDGWRAVWIRTI